MLPSSGRSCSTQSVHTRHKDMAFSLSSESICWVDLFRIVIQLELAGTSKSQSRAA